MSTQSQSSVQCFSTSENSYWCPFNFFTTFTAFQNSATDTPTRFAYNTTGLKMPFDCEICGRILSGSGHLKTHLRTHTGEKPFKCEVCGKCFANSGAWKTHAKTHTGDKPFKCDTCGRKFANSGAQKTHSRTHTGEKPYRCEVCDKRFANSGAWKTHLKIHIGDRPYKCETCGKDFSNPGARRIHVKSHSGAKPFKCPSCGNNFANSGALKVHMLSHVKTQEPGSINNTCDKAFPASSPPPAPPVTAQSPLKCQIQPHDIVCDRVFTLTSPLPPHIQNHPKTTLSVPTTSICEKTFNMYPSPINHLKPALPLTLPQPPQPSLQLRDVCDKAIGSSPPATQSHQTTPTQIQSYGFDCHNKGLPPIRPFPVPKMNIMERPIGIGYVQ